MTFGPLEEVLKALALLMTDENEKLGARNVRWYLVEIDFGPIGFGTVGGPV